MIAELPTARETPLPRPSASWRLAGRSRRAPWITLALRESKIPNGLANLAGALMDENAKREFDALQALATQAWNEWDHKTRHEWRLTFAIWAALGAASLARLQTSSSIPPDLVASACAILVLLHAWFLTWLHGRLDDFRVEHRSFRDRMPGSLVPATAKRVRQNAFRRLFHSSVLVQLCVTVLLSFILWALSSAQATTVKAEPPQTLRFELRWCPNGQQQCVLTQTQGTFVHGGFFTTLDSCNNVVHNLEFFGTKVGRSCIEIPRK